MSAIKFYVKDENSKTLSGVKVDISDKNSDVIESFVSGNRFKSIELSNGEYRCQISSDSISIDEMEFGLKVGSTLRLTEEHPNIVITEDKLTVYVSEQVLTVVTSNDEPVSEEPPTPQKIDENNGPIAENDKSISDKVTNTTSVNIPASRPISIYMAPTKNAKQCLFVGGVRIIEENEGWYKVKYTTRGQGTRKTGYIKSTDLVMRLG